MSETPTSEHEHIWERCTCGCRGETCYACHTSRNVDGFAAERDRQRK